MAVKSIAPFPMGDRITIEKHAEGRAEGWTRDWVTYIVYGPMPAIIATGICKDSQIPEGRKRVMSSWTESQNGGNPRYIGVTKKLNSHVRVVLDDPEGELKNRLESLLQENETRPRGHLRLVWSAPN